MVRRGKALPLDALETRTVYQVGGKKMARPVFYDQGSKCRSFTNNSHIYTPLLRQALLYAAHELHGFFAHLGVLDEDTGELRCFPAPGRVARQGLPTGWAARCERRVAEAPKGAGASGMALRRAMLCPVKVVSLLTDDRVRCALVWRDVDAAVGSSHQNTTHHISDVHSQGRCASSWRWCPRASSSSW